MRLFYVPVTNKITKENYNKTVKDRITRSGKRILEILPNEFERLNFGLWGFRAGDHNQREYDKISKGDVLFFRINDNAGYQCFDGFAYIYDKFISSDVSNYAWNDSSFKNILILGRYNQFLNPLKLSRNKEIVSSLDKIASGIWHHKYNMFREWNLKDQIIEEDLIEKMNSNSEVVNVYDVEKEWKTDVLEAFSNIDQISNITETERHSIVKQRIGQGKFRDQLCRIESKCRICGLTKKELLVASHIKRWSKSDAHERLDIDNGLLLCAQHDALFDNGFITFQQDGKIIISDELDETTQLLANISTQIKITLSDKNKNYMIWHNEECFKRVLN